MPMADATDRNAVDAHGALRYTRLLDTSLVMSYHLGRGIAVRSMRRTQHATP